MIESKSRDKKWPLSWLIGGFLFLLAQLFFTYKGVETFPFVNWGMYSGSYPEQDYYEVILLKVNGQEINLYEWPRKRRDAFRKVIRYYRSWQANNYKDRNEELVKSRFDNVSKSIAHLIIRRITHKEASKEQFKVWLYKYLDQFFDVSIRHVQVDIYYYSYERPLDTQKSIVLLDYQPGK